MKIIHLNTFDIRGGAARAVYRIHHALRKNGIDSEMLVAQKESQDDTVKKYNISFKERRKWFYREILGVEKQKNNTHHSCNVFPSCIHRKINKSNADIVHFHWIGDDLISIPEVKKIKIPIVWTLHDMWAFCGAEHCHDVIRKPFLYQDGYRENFDKENLFDLNRWILNKKIKYWSNVKINFIAPSRWMVDCFNKSSFLSKKEIDIIPNCLDTEIFKQKNVVPVKNKLSSGGKIVLFGADGGCSNPLKGYHLLTEALKKIAKKDIFLVIFGEDKESETCQLNEVTVVKVGKINNDELLSEIYSAADVFVAPSLIDNLPNTIMESMSCGTPCVGFDIGGIPDMIDHKENGFIAEPFNTDSLAEGISWILDQEEKHYKKIRESARKKVLETYSQIIIAEKYKSLYNKILSSN
ncbi:glycosyltransferase family 4 protein [Candidatus Electronema sp. JM]|uniref:glycosyltransferase family 4 protein n=1 Tax=Candidatus Electronema sp. JM TaxID=3401571 RepID=UPI003AA85A18